MKNAIMIFFLLLACVFINSCIIAVVDYPGSQNSPRIDDFYRIIPLDSGGTFSIANIIGDIEISGWEQNEVEVSADIFLAHQSETRVRFGWNIKNTEIDVDRFEDSVKVRTRAKRGNTEVNYVDYSVHVPESIHLKDISVEEGNVFISDVFGEASVEIKRGDLEIENFSGSVRAVLGIGSIKAELYDIRDDDEIVLSVRQGDIEIYLQSDINIQIDCSALNGEINSDFDLGVSLPADKVLGQLGEGGAVLSIATTNGDVWIKKIEESKSE